MNNKHFNDEQDFINDDGFYEYADSSEIPQEWLDEEEEYFSERELDPADSGEYDAVQDGEPSDHLDRYDEDFDWDDDETPIGLEYDTYNDADNY